MSRPDFIYIREAAEYLRIGKSKLYDMCKKRAISHSGGDGKRIYFYKSDLDAYLASQRVEAVEQPKTRAPKLTVYTGGKGKKKDKAGRRIDETRPISDDWKHKGTGTG